MMLNLPNELNKTFVRRCKNLSRSSWGKMLFGLKTKVVNTCTHSLVKTKLQGYTSKMILGFFGHRVAQKHNESSNMAEVLHT